MNHIKLMLIGVAVLLVLGLAGLPVLNYLPLLLILGCGLMMVFMMGGSHDADTRRDSKDDDHLHAGHDQREDQ